MPSTNLSVSFVIPNYNGVKLLKQHLSYVIDAAKGAEIIIVDDASTDESVPYLTQNFPDIKVVSLPINQRFAGACNAGVMVASGEIIILLNSDVRPESRFLLHLLKKFEDPLVFAVGCAELNPYAKIRQVSGRSGGTFSRGLIIHWRCKDQTKDNTLWVSGGSGAFRKSIWQKLGGMDTMFKPAYEEDRDLCYRAMKRGYKVKFCPESLVYHHHETTNKTVFGESQMKIVSYKNHLLIVWKNITNPIMCLKHLLWLPYHLVFTSFRSKGLFLKGFISALSQLPEIINRRQIEINESTVNDEEVLAAFKE